MPLARDAPDRRPWHATLGGGSSSTPRGGLAARRGPLGSPATTQAVVHPWRGGPKALAAGLLTLATASAVVTLMFYGRMVADADRTAMATGAYDPKDAFPGPLLAVRGVVTLLHLLALVVAPFLVVASVLTLAAGRDRMSRGTRRFVLAVTAFAAVALTAAYASGADLTRWMLD
jgi:hypothetical protein